jgi:hypothetical protein
MYDNDLHKDLPFVSCKSAELRIRAYALSQPTRYVAGDARYHIMPRRIFMSLLAS